MVSPFLMQFLTPIKLIGSSRDELQENEREQLILQQQLEVERFIPPFLNIYFGKNTKTRRRKKRIRIYSKTTTRKGGNNVVLTILTFKEMEARMAQERIKMEEERAKEMERLRIQRLNEEMEMVCYYWESKILSKYLGKKFHCRNYIGISLFLKRNSS